MSIEVRIGPSACPPVRDGELRIRVFLRCQICGKTPPARRTTVAYTPGTTCTPERTGSSSTGGRSTQVLCQEGPWVARVRGFCEELVLLTSALGVGASVGPGRPRRGKGPSGRLDPTTERSAEHFRKTTQERGGLWWHQNPKSSTPRLVLSALDSSRGRTKMPQFFNDPSQEIHRVYNAHV